MHGFLEVDGVQHPNLVRLIDDLAALILHGLAVLAQLGRAPLEHFSAFHQDGALGVGDNIAAVHLHQVRFQPEAGLAGAGTADHQHIFVSGGLGVLGTAVHGQALGFCQDDVILEHRVDVRGNIVMGAPTGAAVLHIVAVFLGVLGFQIHRQPQASAAAQAHSQVQRVQTGPETLQCSGQDREQGKKFLGSICPHSQPPRFPEVGGEQAQQDIGQVQKNQLFHIQLLHRSSSFRLFRSTTAFLISALKWLSLASTDGRSLRSAFLTFF